MTDYDDLCARLRELYVQHGTNYVQAAADVIAALRAENAALLTLIRSISYRLNGGLHDSITKAIAAECDALLAGKEGP
jgi:hypothetical protein